MKDRLLRLCLRAYPRERRRADGEAILDLARELAADNGALREGFALGLCGFTRNTNRREPAVRVQCFAFGRKAALCMEGDRFATCGDVSPIWGQKRMCSHLRGSGSSLRSTNARSLPRPQSMT